MGALSFEVLIFSVSIRKIADLQIFFVPLHHI